mmetsp:Transcript_22522/g.54025  ORF Transcript_22522/g.54025 Transcript_22522/m.54025 type:complete len:171 (-) Transcript_22522:40-552(-)
MGNLFSTSADKEIKRLTKKNTKVNRAVLHQHEEGDEHGGETPATLKKSASLTFVRTVTEVMYDHEDGQIEVIQEPLHPAPGDEEEMEIEEPQRPATAHAVGSNPPANGEPAKKMSMVSTGFVRGRVGTAGARGNSKSPASSPTAGGILKRRQLADANQPPASPLPRSDSQ